MFETMGGVLAAVAMAAVFALVGGYRWWQRGAAESAMAEVAPAYGLTVTGGLRQTMRGSVDGIGVEVGTISRSMPGNEALYTEFRLKPVSAPKGRIAPATLREKAIGLAKGTPELITGDPVFDAAVRVMGTRREMLAHLDADARAAVVAAAAEGWWLEDGAWEALEASRITDPARLRLLLDVGLAVARACALEGSIDEALNERATSDPVEAVREGAKAEGGTAPLASGGGDLEAALQDPSRAFDAAVQLAASGDDREAVRLALVGALPDPQRTAQAIEGLALVGGPMEAMALRVVGGEHQDAAQAAIAAIEAR